MISGISDGPGISWDESPDEEPPEEMSPEAELEESFLLALGLQPARLASTRAAHSKRESFRFMWIILSDRAVGTEAHRNPSRPAGSEMEMVFPWREMRPLSSRDWKAR